MTLRRIYIIGIGGIGLSSIARILLAEGWQVSGSDATASPITSKLEQAGATVHIGHRAENVRDADLVLVTSAAPQDNPEVAEARRRQIPILKRSDLFPALTKGKKTIAVAGTHGKTTTTGMIGTILTNAGLDPSVIVGGIIPELNGNARAGKGEYIVVEADEYDHAFLGLTPRIAVVTSIEMDHPDIYPDIDEMQRAFQQFLSAVPEGGLVLGFGDSKRVTQTMRSAHAQTATFGLGGQNDWRLVDMVPNDRGGMSFGVVRGASWFGEFELQIPGVHNGLNALAAIVVADAVRVQKQVVRDTLAQFRGAVRRFQVKGESGGVTIVDDYAHHPTEIRATLSAARVRYPSRTIWAVCQPHTYSRTLALLDDFAGAFADADHVIITEVYAAREHDTLGVSGKQIVDRMSHRDVRFVASLDETIKLLASLLHEGDVLITLGAGDVNRVGMMLQSQLQGARNV